MLCEILLCLWVRTKRRNLIPMPINFLAITATTTWSKPPGDIFAIFSSRSTTFISRCGSHIAKWNLHPCKSSMLISTGPSWFTEALGRDSRNTSSVRVENIRELLMASIPNRTTSRDCKRNLRLGLESQNHRSRKRHQRRHGRSNRHGQRFEVCRSEVSIRFWQLWIRNDTETISQRHEN